MKQDRISVLETYIKANMSPLLLEDVSDDIFVNDIIINADCDISLLNGHYEGTSFVAPDWYQDLLDRVKKERPIIVIKNINMIPVTEQNKFIEILKYRKISTFELPEQCLIIVTANNLNNHPISEDVYSLLIHI